MRILKKVTTLAVSMMFICNVAYGQVKTPKIIGKLTILDKECKVPLALSLITKTEVQKAQKAKFDLETDRLHDKEKRFSYYMSDSKLKFSISDGEDVIKTNIDGDLYLDDNDSESAGIILEIPFGKLFDYRAYKNDKVAELELKQETEKTTYRAALTEKYLAFRSSSEKVDILGPNTAGEGLIFKGSHESLVTLRQKAVAYYLHSDPLGTCIITWLGSGFVK